MTDTTTKRSFLDHLRTPAAAEAWRSGALASMRDEQRRGDALIASFDGDTDAVSMALTKAGVSPVKAALVLDILEGAYDGPWLA